jgi:glutamate dehydrogenase (NADP+)
LSAKVLERLTEPDRVVIFRVEWEDDNGDLQVNRGYRVQFNNALGPYKGGIRFHPSVTLGGLKFLAFEQTFKNALTGLPLGGGKGGSDFHAKGKSQNEIRRFAKAFMTELQKYIGPDLDVPAGDIGVGTMEIGYLYGTWKRLRSEHVGVLTGKARNWGGSLIRPEATGFGAVYFLEHMMRERGDALEGKRIAVSGFGNVAWGAVTKAAELGAKVVTISGPDGYIVDEDGIAGEEKLDYMLELRASNNDAVAPYAEKFKATFVPDRRPWEVPVDVAIPCAIQNELSGEDGKTLVSNGVSYVVEASNMGCTAEAVEVFEGAGIPVAPGKAANAGGVAVSGLEMSQNAMKLSWTREEVETKLKQIMGNIHLSCVGEGKRSDGSVDYIRGANIAGFRRVADAMIDLGY